MNSFRIGRKFTTCERDKRYQKGFISIFSALEREKKMTFADTWYLYAGLATFLVTFILIVVACRCLRRSGRRTSMHHHCADATLTHAVYALPPSSVTDCSQPYELNGFNPYLGWPYLNDPRTINNAVAIARANAQPSTNGQPQYYNFSATSFIGTGAAFNLMPHGNALP